jgi:hypothetical protein
VTPKLDKSHLIIAVFAAVVMLSGFIIQNLIGMQNYPISIVMWVNIVIVLFYFLGIIIRYYLIKSVFMIETEVPEALPGAAESAPSPDGETPMQDMMAEAPMDFDDERFEAGLDFSNE